MVKKIKQKEDTKNDELVFEAPDLLDTTENKDYKLDMLRFESEKIEPVDTDKYS